MTTLTAPPYAPERSLGIPRSSLHDIHRLVEAHPAAVIPLHVGEPYFGMPEAAKHAFVEAIVGGRTQYTDAPGLPALRAAIADALITRGAPSPDLVFVTPGSCQGLAATIQSIAVDGGAVMLPDVHWPTHLQQIALAGMETRFFSLPCEPDRLPQALDAAWRPGTRAVIVNSPSNPSGVVLSPVALRLLHEWALRRDVWVIADEAYEDFVRDGSPTVPLATIDAELPPDLRIVFSVHTFSKAYSMTGCRLGYVVAPNRARAEVLQRVQEALLISPSTPVQYAGIAALADTAHVQAHAEYVQGTADAAVDLLARNGLLWVRPAGGWYALVDLGAQSIDSDAFCSRLLEDVGVALAPGRAFFPAGHPIGERVARVALCGERRSTLTALERLLGWVS